MSSSQPTDERPCRVCGAMLPAGAPVCWLCHNSREPENVTTSEQPVAVGQPTACEARAGFQFSMATMMLTVTLVAVLAGATRTDPGVGFVLIVASVPALIRTYLVVYRRKRQGRNVSPLEKVGMYVGSLVVTLIIVTVIGGAAFGAFFGVCFGTVALADDLDAVAPGLVLGIIAAIVALILTAWPMFLWVRRRWRKAVAEEKTPGKTR